MQPCSADIVILGGGLAGLTLAIQIRQTQPERSVIVLERGTHPVRHAAHKVGESTVELSAYYFSEMLGLKTHLRDFQLPKFGLRFFFRDDPGQPLSRGLEIGGNRAFPVPTYQIDRGIFENYLAERASELGVEFHHGCTVRDVKLVDTGDTHTVVCRHRGDEQRIQCRWVVDASGRAGILKRRLGLHKPVDHRVDAAWFRLAGRIDVEDWCSDSGWKRFGERSRRWLSTNHLMGPGYWVWLIPLASGSTSVGIVADPRLHPLKGYSTFEAALDWLERHEPQCARAVRERRDGLQDFLRLKDFSYSCSRVFSGERWALTGEAGVFLDPFYSPGSDFIALNNLYVGELIRRDFAGDDTRRLASIFEKLFFSFFYNSLELFRDQYPLFGNPVVMPVKLMWDFSLYWSVLAFLFIQGGFTDLSFIACVQSEFGRIESLNRRMQQFFRDWHARSDFQTPQRYLDHVGIDHLYSLNSRLAEPLDKQAALDRFRENVRELESLAEEIVSRVEASENGATAAPAPRLDEVFKTLGL